MLKDIVDELMILNDDNLAQRVIDNNDVQWCLSELQDMLAADVAPVVHGDWILRHIGAGHYWECSVCHTNPCIYVTEHTKFCPNCGARMDGGADHDA